MSSAVNHNVVNSHTTYNTPLSSDSDGSESSQASLETITPERRNATTDPRGILRPPHRPAPQVLERGCIVCSSTTNLRICHICQGAYLCADHLYPEDHAHKECCRSVQNAWAYLHHAQAQQVEGHPAYTDRVILKLKYRLAIEYSRMGTYRSVQTAVGLYYETSRETCLHSRYFEERFLVPKELLRLGELEESYYYTKFWTVFAGVQQEHVDERNYRTPIDGTCFWERGSDPIIPRGRETTLNCLLIMLMIKLTLWLNIKDIQSAGVLCRKKGVPPEVAKITQLEVACPVILENEKIYNDIYMNRPLTIHTRRLNREVVRLREAIHNGNNYFWTVLVMRNQRQWAYYGCDCDKERKGEVPPTRYLRRRELPCEATFAVYNNLRVLDGRMGKAVEYVFAVRDLVNRPGASMFGPNAGWLKAPNITSW